MIDDFLQIIDRLAVLNPQVVDPGESHDGSDLNSRFRRSLRGRLRSEQNRHQWLIAEVVPSHRSRSRLKTLTTSDDRIGLLLVEWFDAECDLRAGRKRSAFVLRHVQRGFQRVRVDQIENRFEAGDTLAVHVVHLRDDSRDRRSQRSFMQLFFESEEFRLERLDSGEDWLQLIPTGFRFFVVSRLGPLPSFLDGGFEFGDEFPLTGFGKTEPLDVLFRDELADLLSSFVLPFHPQQILTVFLQRAPQLKIFGGVFVRVPADTRGFSFEICPLDFQLVFGSLDLPLDFGLTTVARSWPASTDSPSAT
jgi:hypothetical protein